MVDLPHPLSPTRATVCGRSVKLNCLSALELITVEGMNVHLFSGVVPSRMVSSSSDL